MGMSQIQDQEFGTIQVKTNTRCRRITFRCADGQLVCTVPVLCTKGSLHSAIDELRPRLRSMLERAQDRNIGARFCPSTRIDTEDYHFWMEEGRVSRPTFRQQMGQLVCYYPAGIDWSDGRLQALLTNAVEESLRQHAKILLPPRLQAMALARGLTFRDVTIRKTKGRWGSCSSKGNISLSLYLMVLPRHLQDYVMQHELTHLLEMNHGSRFWALLDEAVGGCAVKYRSEMRNFDTSVF